MSHMQCTLDLVPCHLSADLHCLMLCIHVSCVYSNPKCLQQTQQLLSKLTQTQNQGEGISV